MTAYTVGQLAERSGVPATTLRYYDDIGLLVPRRSSSGHRRYDASAADVLQLIQLCRILGLSLAEIAVVLGNGGREARRAIAIRKVRDVDRAIAQLTTVRQVLEHFAACAHAEDETPECRATVQAIWTRVNE
jgi:DNA-binding transcriptional MerR regulator